MGDKLKEFYEKASDVFFGLTKKFDGISEKIFEQTGVKVNVGAIVLGAALIIFLIVFVKSILGWLWSML